MLEIIALYFLTIHNGKIAAQKGLKPLTWKINTILAWIIGEIIGVFIGMAIFGFNNLILIMLFALPCAFGGFHFIKHTLEKKPDQNSTNFEQSID
ncbi:MAG: hypothetical protein IPL09_12200 [Bacteroidetes bacterium]|jgi:hypothetical protein|nr:hypothetical protein [Bacteroidota bacterium]HQW47281.1 hypothetical protein [Chitinophagaceae bacterium]MBK6818770.1 hypothetical protein [Bacteroidota bacterium]MBK7040014.1 hypothetical protein [Bacteroidota bacterium]MBK7587118.1 hypothetical protein [Bacteroidota bacterium]